MAECIPERLLANSSDHGCMRQLCFNDPDAHLFRFMDFQKNYYALAFLTSLFTRYTPHKVISVPNIMCTFNFSSRINQPSNTATIGLMYAYMETSVGGSLLIA